MAFAHLHSHSNYSLLAGACRIPDMVKKAKDLGQTAMALTDHGFLYGAMEFYTACITAGVKPIIGLELTMVSTTVFEKDKKDVSHIVLLAKDEAGYHNLLRLASEAATTGFYYEPRCDGDMLRKYHEGLICLSGCMKGPLSRRLLAGEYDEAREKAAQLHDIFGEDFFVELQYHGLSEQRTILPRLIGLAREQGLRWVATNDVKYVNQEDAPIMAILTAIKTKTALQDKTDLTGGIPAEFYMKSEEQMREIFDKIAPGAVDAAQEIADRCSVTISDAGYQLPAFPTPPDQPDNYTYLKKLSWAGLKKRYGAAAEKHIPQLKYELETIEKMGFTDYMLIVADFIRYARETGIPVGPGRGSAAGSLAAYCLGITTVDPIQYGLRFERFLNPQRVTMPDIDVDFDVPNGREAVINYVAEKYGPTHLANIVTFGRLLAKGAIRDVGKALGMTPAQTASITRLVPDGPKVSIEEALAGSTRLKRLYETDADVRKVIDLSRKIEGFPRNTSTHAAGVIMAPGEVAEFAPIMRNAMSPGLAVSQYDMATIEKIGLLKVDFLGVRTLNIIQDTIERVNEGRAREDALDIWAIDYDDPSVYQFLATGDTVGIFQLGSSGMQDLLSKLQPTCLEDLIAVIALYRPGPMDTIPTFIKGKQHPESISYLHPSLKPILETTYGCIVYQEQVMDIVRELAGYSYGHADLVRRAMSKKKASAMAEEKEAFLHGKQMPDGTWECEGCLKRGIPLAVAEKLWAQMETFAAYAFNKAHAVAYATIAYRTAYLKCHHPLEYMAALLTSAAADSQPKKVQYYLLDCEKKGIPILPPNINHSYAKFTVEDGAIRFGLLAVKEAAKGVISELVAGRGEGSSFQPYQSLHDLMQRCPRACEKRTLETLIKCGAMDGLDANRAQMLAVLPSMLASAKKVRQDVLAEQIRMEDSFFTDASTDTRLQDFTFPATEYPELKEIPLSEKLEQEFEAVGFYISGHPMNAYKDFVSRKASHRIADLLEPAEDFTESNGGTFHYKTSGSSVVRVAGIVSAVKTSTTKKNRPMCNLTLSDQTGKLKATVFPDAYAAYGQQIKAGVPVLLYGKMEDSDFGRSLVVNSVEQIS